MINAKAERGAAARSVKVRRLDPDDPMIARVNAELTRFEEDQRFFGDMYDELLERCPESWVAVYHKEIVGVDTDFGRLLKTLKSRGYPLSRLAINRVTAETTHWILGGEIIDCRSAGTPV